MNVKVKNWHIAVACMLMGGGAAIASAQYQAPPADPGYSAFYHDSEDAQLSAHWGYHDGLADGSHDRETGHSFRPTHDNAYKHARSWPSPIGQDRFQDIYREAYVHGYGGEGLRPLAIRYRCRSCF